MVFGTPSSSADCSGLGAPSPPPIHELHSADNSLSSGVGGSTSGSLSPEDAGFKQASGMSSLDGSVGSASADTPVLSLVNVGDVSGSDDDSASASCDDDDVSTDEDSWDWTAKDKCRYYDPRDDGCTEPRSCRDCLNVKLDEDYGCMVNQYGRCVKKTKGSYVSALDYRNQTPSNDCAVGVDQKVQFPSDAATYCHPYDKQCEKCKDGVFEDVMEGRLNGSLTKFCYGTDGCVCIAVCEAPIWFSTVGQTVCNGTTVNKDYESEHANTYGGSKSGDDDDKGHGVGTLLLSLFGGMAAVMLLVVAVDFARKQRRTARAGNSSGTSNSGSAQGGEGQGGDAADGSASSGVTTAPHLSLFGWQAMRSELIEREQLLLAGVEDFSNVRSGYLQLLDVDASAPPQEEEESSAPVLLVPLAGASAPTFSPRDVHAFASAPSAPPASPTFEEDELL